MAFVEAALFAGLATAWIDSLFSGCSTQLKWLARVAACASTAAVGLAWYHSPESWTYLAVHGINVLAWVGVEVRKTAPGGSARSLVICVCSAALLGALLAVVDRDQKESSLAQSVRKRPTLPIPERPGDVGHAAYKAIDESVTRRPTQSDGPLTAEGVTTDPLAAILSAVRDATVRVINESNDQEGSGVLIANDGEFAYALTAGHLLRRHDEIRVEILRPVANDAERELSATVVAHVIDVAPDADLAILRFVAQTDTPAPLRIHRRAPRQADVFHAISCGVYEGLTTRLQQGTAVLKSVRVPSSARTSELFEFDEHGEYGRSGGPLVNDQGEVVGIASGRSGDKAYFTPTFEVHKILISNGLRWIMHDSKPGHRPARLE